MKLGRLAPHTTLTDDDVAGALRRAVDLINPILDLLSQTDPLQIKERTRHPGESQSTGGRVLDAMAWLVNAADIPGTANWRAMDVDARVNWWVWRVGALDTLVVAFPGTLGIVADRLGIQDLLGFTSQAIVLCAVARELGVTDRHRQVELLGSILCDRQLSATPTDDAPTAAAPSGWYPVALVKSVWHLAAVLGAISTELTKRPHPTRIFRYLGMLPGIGAVADYFGEYTALIRAAQQAQRLLTEKSP